MLALPSTLLAVLPRMALALLLPLLLLPILLVATHSPPQVQG